MCNLDAWSRGDGRGETDGEDAAWSAKRLGEVGLKWDLPLA